MKQKTCIENQIKIELQKLLSQERYTHTIGVMNMAESIAVHYQGDSDTVRLAGLLHDCAKYISPSQLLQICEKNGLPVTVAERKNPSLLHAKVGAFLARTKYGVEDMEILNAITYHTTGRPNMNLTEKIIYISDYIEPNRNLAPDLEKLRFLVFEDIDECLYEILESITNYLKNSHNVIDSMTEETYLWYKNKRNRRVENGSIKING